MRLIKTITAAALAGLMLLNLFACTSGDGKESTTTSGNEEENEIKFTEEEIAMYRSYIEENSKRALEIANATVGVYMNKSSYERMNLVMLSENCSISPNQSSFSGTGTASVWHYTAFWAMESKILALTTDESTSAYYSQLYKDTHKSMEYYQGTANIVTYKGTEEYTMYAVNRSNTANRADITGIAAVYDDQMWIIRELIYGYRLTGSPLYLSEAERLTEVCLDGWDVTPDANGNEIGGICWGPGYQTKHTCSNAPLILPLVQLSEIYTEAGDSEKADYYLNWAVKVYDFCQKYFAHGNVYGDLVGSSRVEEGSGRNKHYVTTNQSTGLDTHTYTYNTGTMISGAAALYRVTGESKYLNTAKRSARGSISHFTDSKLVDGYYLWPCDATIWFNLIMLEGYIELYDADPELALKGIKTFQDSLDYGYENFAKEGFLPANYLKGWDKKNSKDSSKSVMDQATAASMYAMLADFYSGIIEGM